MKDSTKALLKLAAEKRKANGYKQKAWNKGKIGIYTEEQRERISASVKEHALTRLKEKGYHGGVGFHKASGKWRAYIVESRLGSKVQISKGLYGSKEEAEGFLRRDFPCTR